MKKVAILVASALVLGSFGTRTFAAEVNTQTTQPTEAVVSYKEEAGITPDSLLYTIDKAVDDLRVLLAGSEEKEAAVNADIAQERLGESEVMAEEGKTELAEGALEEYNSKITEAVDKLKEVVTSAEATSGESTDSKLEQSISDLEKAIQEVQDKSLVVLDNLKDVIAKDSVETVEDVIEEQTAHKEAVANFVKERHEFNAVKKTLNAANVELKKVEKSGTEEEVKAAQDKLTAVQSEYVTAQTELHSAFQAKKAADSAVKDKKEKAKLETSTQAPAEQTTSTGGTATTSTEGTATTPAEGTVPAADDTAAQGDVKAFDDGTDSAIVAEQTQYTKTNNGNGNGNNPVKVEKPENKDKEKPAPQKSGEAQDKSTQVKGKK